MRAKILSAGALTLLLTGGALASTAQPQQLNIYAGHSNSQQGANGRYAANLLGGGSLQGTWALYAGSGGAMPGTTMCSYVRLKRQWVYQCH